MAALLRSIQVLAVAQEHPRVVVLTAGAQEADVNREMGRGLMGAAAWGFMRSIPLEAPQLRTRFAACHESSRPASYEDDIEFWAQSLCKELSSETEREIVYTRDRLTRRDEMSKGSLEALQSLDITVRTCACDVAQTDAVADLLLRNCVGGIVHAAGVIDFVELKAAANLPFVSLNLGPVAEDKFGQADSALRLTPPKHFQAAIRRVLECAGTCLPSSVCFAQVDWTRFLRELGADIAILDKFSEVDVTSRSAASPFQSLAGDELEQQLGEVVQEIAQRFLSEDHSADSPLMESGLDSLSAIDFRNSVAKELGVKLPSTLMFDHPTTKAVAAFAASLISSKPAGTPAVPAAQSSIAGTPCFGDKDPLAVGSGACRFPLEGTTPRQMWDALAEKIDAVTEIPADRWDVDEYFDSDPEVPGMMTVRHGAFVKGADLFDAAFFGLSPVESKIMDPQQRLLLEVVYQSFHVAGMPMTALTGMSACITVGQCHQDWGHVGFGTDSSSLKKIGAYTGLGVSTAVSSNRVSYLLGLKGPSVTVDTACSSSLVAVDIAVSALRRGRSTVAASSGVNLCLLPAPFVACSKAHMLSQDGRCKTFDASANGYARGEGCGSVTLSLSETRATVVLRGSAVNQDGRSSSQTAPHGPSQEAVMRTALSEAELEPSSVSAVETHGTGTALGDPIEVGAFRNTLREGRHLEAAAGLAGLMKIISALPLRMAAPNLHFQSLNPHCDLEDFPTVIPVELSELATVASHVSSGLSSFGFGGTNAHVVLEDSAERPSVLVEAPIFKRQSFAWQAQRHALLTKTMRTAEGSQVFLRPFSGKLLELVSHHIIFGEIVVPGATYIEMALGVGVVHFGGRDKQWNIRKVGFTSPLVLKQLDTGELTRDVSLQLGLIALDAYDGSICVLCFGCRQSGQMPLWVCSAGPIVGSVTKGCVYVAPCAYRDYRKVQACEVVCFKNALQS
ncbi:eryA [Symbiodinium sp. CCMP2456]|nr:eryA [Symbiodinium sp. CCMP2456]